MKKSELKQKTDENMSATKSALQTVIDNLSETYDEFISNIINVRGRDSVDGYSEVHHIIPKCLGGTNDEENLVRLTAKEHYIAHKLLAIENPNCSKLQFAWWNMCHCRNENRYICSPEDYEEARIRHSNNVSKINSGKNHWAYGKHLSEETKEKLRKTNSGVSHPCYGRINEKNPRSRIVVCENNGFVFPSVNAVYREFGIKAQSVSSCCRGVIKSAGKMFGKRATWRYLDENDLEYPTRQALKLIYQYLPEEQKKSNIRDSGG